MAALQRPTRQSAKEIGISLEELQQLTGVDATATAAAPAAAAAATAPSEDDESIIGPRRSVRRTKRIGDDEDDYEAEESPESSESESERSSAHEDQRALRPRREAASRINYSEDQLAREALRRGRQELGESEEDEHETRPREQVLTSYFREMKKDLIRLADGREITEREYRFILRDGEKPRVLREGEEPGEPFTTDGHDSTPHQQRHHEGDVRRSTRTRQPVQHFNIDEQDEQPRETRMGAGRRAAANKGRRQGGSRRHQSVRIATSQPCALCAID